MLIDRGLGLLGLILLAAIAASAAHTEGVPAGPVPAALLWIVFAGATVVAAPAVASPGAAGARCWRRSAACTPNGWARGSNSCRAC